jgi:hypothetical protein
VPTFKLSDFDGAPSFGGSNERTEHQFQKFGELAAMFASCKRAIAIFH